MSLPLDPVFDILLSGKHSTFNTWNTRLIYVSDTILDKPCRLRSDHVLGQVGLWKTFAHGDSPASEVGRHTQTDSTTSTSSVSTVSCVATALCSLENRVVVAPKTYWNEGCLTFRLKDELDSSSHAESSSQICSLSEIRTRRICAHSGLSTDK